MYRRIVEAKCYIDRHYAQKIELDHISEQACFSKYHFRRLFKKSYGLSPHKYLTSVRINQAKKRLGQGASIAEACYEVGFDSIPSFTHLFKRQVGLSPGAYADLISAQLAQKQQRPLSFIPSCFAKKFASEK